MFKFSCCIELFHRLHLSDDLFIDPRFRYFFNRSLLFLLNRGNAIHNHFVSFWCERDCLYFSISDNVFSFQPIGWSIGNEQVCWWDECAEVCQQTSGWERESSRKIARFMSRESIICSVNMFLLTKIFGWIWFMVSISSFKVQSEHCSFWILSSLFRISSLLKTPNYFFFSALSCSAKGNLILALRQRLD